MVTTRTWLQGPRQSTELRCGSNMNMGAGRLTQWWSSYTTTDRQLTGNRKTRFLGGDSNGVHQSAPRGGILLISGKFQSQDTWTQMRIQLTRTASPPTLEDEIIKAANLVLLGSGKPVAKTDGTLSLSSDWRILWKHVRYINRDHYQGRKFSLLPKDPALHPLLKLECLTKGFVHGYWDILVAPKNKPCFRCATFTTYSLQVYSKLCLWIERWLKTT